MKRMTSRFALLEIFLSALSLAQLPPITSRACVLGGGGGGTPLVDISAFHPKGHSKIPVQGSVSEFLYWENSKELVYRTKQNSLNGWHSSTGSTEIDPNLNSPISRVIEGDEKYILEAFDTRFLDLSLSKWNKFSTKYPLNRHLFWAQENSVDVLYSLSDVYSMVPGCQCTNPADCGKKCMAQTLVIYRYGAGAKVPTNCNLHALPGEQFFIGEGQFYPNLFVYKTNKDPKGGSNVFLYAVDVRKAASVGSTPNCSLTPLFPPTMGSSMWVPGNVENVYLLPEQNGVMQKFSSFVVKTDDPTDNVLWMYRKTVFDPLKCEAFNFNGRQPLVLPSSKSVLATWSKEEGAMVVLPQAKQYLKVFKGLAVDRLREEDFWLANNGDLFFANAESASNDRQLYVTNINK